MNNRMSNSKQVEILYCCDDAKRVKQSFFEHHNIPYNSLKRIRWKKLDKDLKKSYEGYKFRCSFCGFPLEKNRYE